MANRRAVECCAFIQAMTNGRIAASGDSAPVFTGNEMVGACGISGGPSQQNAEVSVYARARIGRAQHPESDTTDPSVKEHINALYAAAGITDHKL